MNRAPDALNLVAAGLESWPCIFLRDDRAGDRLYGDGLKLGLRFLMNSPTPVMVPPCRCGNQDVGLPPVSVQILGSGTAVTSGLVGFLNCCGMNGIGVALDQSSALRWRVHALFHPA